MRDHHGWSVAGSGSGPRRFRSRTYSFRRSRENVSPLPPIPSASSSPGTESKAAKPMDLKDFAAHVVEKFQVNKIEPWTGHFPSTDPKYLEQFRAAVEKADAAVVNIAVDGEHSPYAMRSLRARAGHRLQQAVGRQCGDHRLAQHSHQYSARERCRSRTSIAPRKAWREWLSMPRQRTLSLRSRTTIQSAKTRFSWWPWSKKVNNPWLHTLPDFGNTLAATSPTTPIAASMPCFARLTAFRT